MVRFRTYPCALGNLVYRLSMARRRCIVVLCLMLVMPYTLFLPERVTPTATYPAPPDKVVHRLGSSRARSIRDNTSSYSDFSVSCAVDHSTRCVLYRFSGRAISEVYFHLLYTWN